MPEEEEKVEEVEEEEEIEEVEEVEVEEEAEEEVEEEMGEEEVEEEKVEEVEEEKEEEEEKGEEWGGGDSYILLKGLNQFFTLLWYFCFLWIKFETSSLHITELNNNELRENWCNEMHILLNDLKEVLTTPPTFYDRIKFVREVVHSSLLSDCEFRKPRLCESQASRRYMSWILPELPLGCPVSVK